MRVLDFLALIRTLNRQTLFYFETSDKTIIPIVDFKIENEHLVFLTAANQKPRQQWELFVLLQQKELLPHLLYVQEAKQQSQAVFGFRLENGKALVQ
ncbi:hypothetical protein FC83_GL000749 [Agrilactobacillus composti DSM 18527 = JCM 14202]|uniref:Uncharacterized protein n=1 Tax=Agrilactobacillus composti DSM 18527 = JCM 14202 TaxID=1423734 RepID=X0PFD0_9LACO|nr:hypothetical protein [Agrilactobacillus composti]KRM31454.1 hypothetical protein FC83_GL000749 [Agrilactobacillus composti DSM 18527 = JCM 14202]GAF40408.1 hypothetical protein JCM14202_2304 [Agrilactobacillus composti DSM 18527 = JCM 14202]